MMTAAEFKKLVLPLHRQLYVQAFRLMGRAEDAEDMLQEAYLKMWSLPHRLPSAAELEPYCRTLVRHLCIDHLRKHQVPVSDEETTLLVQMNPEDTPSELMERRDEASQVLRLVECLPVQQRLAIRLHDVEGCSYGETAEALGMTEGNVRVLLSRARKRIRELFNKR